MSMTPQEAEAWNAQAYGDAKFPERILEVVIDPSKAWMHDPQMIACSLLSDAQELMAMVSENLPKVYHPRLDQARQYINRAKYIIGQFLDYRADPDPNDEKKVTVLVHESDNDCSPLIYTIEVDDVRDDEAVLAAVKKQMAADRGVDDEDAEDFNIGLLLAFKGDLNPVGDWRE